jgi:hypothetical protein
MILEELHFSYFSCFSIHFQVQFPVSSSRQAGWQGKSRVAALRQSMVDGITNSSCEGFRLEAGRFSHPWRCVVFLEFFHDF